MTEPSLFSVYLSLQLPDQATTTAIPVPLVIDNIGTSNGLENLFYRSGNIAEKYGKNRQSHAQNQYGQNYDRNFSLKQYLEPNEKSL